MDQRDRLIRTTFDTWSHLCYLVDRYVEDITPKRQPDSPDLLLGRKVAAAVKQAPVHADQLSNAVHLLAGIRTYDARLNNERGDDARAPTGDDYNRILDLALAALKLIEGLDKALQQHETGQSTEGADPAVDELTRLRAIERAAIWFNENQDSPVSALLHIREALGTR